MLHGFLLIKAVLLEPMNLSLHFIVHSICAAWVPFKVVFRARLHIYCTHCLCECVDFARGGSRERISVLTKQKWAIPNETMGVVLWFIIKVYYYGLDLQRRSWRVMGREALSHR